MSYKQNLQRWILGLYVAETGSVNDVIRNLFLSSSLSLAFLSFGFILRQALRHDPFHSQHPPPSSTLLQAPARVYPLGCACPQVWSAQQWLKYSDYLT